MFDVAHVIVGQRFEVVTDQLVATAKGTVFSVEADGRSSRVRVYEGVVEVEPFVVRDKIQYVRVADYGLSGILAQQAVAKDK